MSQKAIIHNGDSREVNHGEAQRLIQANVIEWSAMLNCYTIVDGRDWRDVDKALNS